MTWLVWNANGTNTKVRCEQILRILFGLFVSFAYSRYSRCRICDFKKTLGRSNRTMQGDYRMISGRKICRGATSTSALSVLLPGLISDSFKAKLNEIG